LTGVAAPLKEKIGAASVARLAEALAAADPGFDAPGFTGSALAGLERLELKARIGQVAKALSARLPDGFDAAAAVVERAVDDPELGVWELWPVTVWTGDAGVGEVERAAALLARVTARASGEFGLRPLIDAEPERMRLVLLEWAGSRDEHLRRLASEGSRPLLPWAPQLAVSRTDPGWAVAVLDRLTDDQSAYVRRSVANHLNDISKLDRELALATARRWRAGGGERTPEVLAHGLRTLTRRGDREALELTGLDPGAEIEVERLSVRPRTVRVGEAVEVEVALRCAGSRSQRADCAYAIEFARPKGRSSRKLFKLGTIELGPGDRATLARRYVFRPLRTRPYHPGRHAIEVLVNGEPRGRATFALEA
jgi:3-methyladenine DNA glycosylase AlkC